MAQKFTNVETYLYILFLFIILISGLAILGKELVSNDNSALDNDSIDYIANIRRINISEYEATRTEIENPILITGNGSQGNPKDEGLDLLFAKQQGFEIELVIKSIFSLPEVIIVDLFRFNQKDWQWLIDIVNWLYRFLVLIAVVYFARGLIR